MIDEAKSKAARRRWRLAEPEARRENTSAALAASLESRERRALLAALADAATAEAEL